MIDNNFINELYEEETKSREVFNEKAWSDTLKENLNKFIKRCVSKVIDNKYNFKYFCLLEAYSYADMGYYYKKCIYYYLYGSNTPFKKELLNKFKKRIYIKQWSKEQGAKLLAFPYISYNKTKLNKSDLPEELRNNSNFSVIYYDADPFNDEK